MIIKEESTYIIERVHRNNPGKGSSPNITRISTHDGLFIIEIYGPPISPSSIKVTDKTKHKNTFFKNLAYIMKLDIDEIGNMTLDEAKEYINLHQK